MTIIDFPHGEARKAIILARVSSKEQEEGHSIDAQKHRLLGYCERRGLEVVKVYEITESSTKGDRAKFTEMINYAKNWYTIENKKIKALNVQRENQGLSPLPLHQKACIAIVADKIDRVQRSFKEYPLLDALVQEGRIELHFNTEGYVIHRGSVSQERLMWSFGVIMAQSYVDNLRDNVKRSQDHMIRNGGYPAMAPIGYLNVRDSGGRSDIILDPDRAPLVRRIFVEYSKGIYTLKQIVEMTKEWGLRNKTRKKEWLSRSHLHMLLTNPFYYGIATIRKESYPHRYATLIDKQTFDQCQAVLKGWNKKRFAYAQKEFIFRGLISCATTGHTVTALQKKKTFQNGNTGEWTYLRCWKPDEPEKIMYIREEIAIEQIEKALKRLYIPEKDLEDITAYMLKTHHVEREFQERRITELNKEHTRIKAQVDSLIELLADKVLTHQDYQTKRNALAVRVKEIEAEIAAHQEADDSFKDSFVFLLQLSRKTNELFKTASVEQKRQLVGLVFENLTLKGSTLCFTYRKPFSWFADTVKSGEWSKLIDTISNSKELRAEIIALAKKYTNDNFVLNPGSSTY